MGAGKIPTLLKIENLFFLVTLAVMISILTVCIHVLESSLLEVFKIIHNYYDTRASINFNFNPVSSTRGNKFKLQKEMCRYDVRKYSFCYRFVNVWNTLWIMW